MIILLPAWSLSLSQFWKLDYIAAMLLVALGTYVGLQFCLNSHENSSEDRHAYHAYNVCHDFVALAAGCV